MTNEKRQGGCAEWCGLPYGDASVPDNAVLWTHEPWTTAKNDPAYCTAACLGEKSAKRVPVCPDWCGTTFMLCDRCKAMAANSGPVKAMVKREPVAPWVRLATPGMAPWEKCANWYCSYHTSQSLADYGDGGVLGACEACAERAGVFGPVSIAAPPPVGPKEPPPQLPCGPVTPTCAGPLATHGTPVTYPGTNQPIGICVAGWARNAGKECGPAVERYGFSTTRKPKKVYTCDVCNLEWEKYVARQQSDPKPSTEPPARIGTVPQVVSVGAGIWASRGMR